jgi:hypothetical protein
MFDFARKRAIHQGAGCWRHPSIVGPRVCDGCGVRCCEHCWLEVPHGELCVECALVFCGVRAPRRRSRADDPGIELAPLATMSWSESSRLIDLAPARRRRREPAAALAELSFFRRAA